MLAPDALSSRHTCCHLPPASPPDSDFAASALPLAVAPVHEIGSLSRSPGLRGGVASESTG
eukprot:1812391-Prymnesium_polylepis.1